MTPTIGVPTATGAPSGELRMAIQDLAKLCLANREVVERLRERLAPVLAPVPPQPPANEPVAKAAQAPGDNFAYDLQRLNASLGAATDELSQIILRLQF